jgi:hypothetical protein
MGRRSGKSLKRGYIMKKKICSSLLTILIFAGIGMSVLNFTTKLYASDVIYGTTTQGTGGLLDGIWHNEGRHLGYWGGADWFCVWEESNCSIVFEV